VTAGPNPPSDPRPGVERAFDNLRRVRAAGTAVVVVEQTVRAALRVADRGYVLDGGETRFEGPAGAHLGSDAVRRLSLGGR
jgi:branched-chain amino acid transport system ATP-binding protein